MNAFLLYVVQSTLCLSLFFGLYLLLLRHEAFFRFNRSVLLSIMLLSTAFPMIRVPVAEPALVQLPMMRLEEKVSSAKFEVSGWVKPEEKVSSSQTETQSSNLKPHTSNLISLVYFAGFFVSLALALVSFISVARIIITARPVVYRQQRILVSPRQISSFTFAGWMVISEMDYERFAAEIITHENIHRQKGHFWDLCLATAITVVHWFNPLAWLLRREMKALHEYEADRSTLTQGIHATRYQLLLIEKAAGASRYSVASGFAQSKIKKRIVMMNKQNPNPWARWKALLFIPLAALLTLAFARPEIKRELEQISAFKGTEILQEIDLLDQKESQMAEVEPDISVISSNSPNFSEVPHREMPSKKEREEAAVVEVKGEQPIHVTENNVAIAQTTPDSIITINESMSYSNDKNNHFTVRSSNEQQVVELKIFNRSGTLVFSTEANVCTWNGCSSSGEPIANGVYFYLAEIRGSSPTISKRGAVQLNNSADQLSSEKMTLELKNSNWNEAAEAVTEFEKITNRQITYNGKTIKVKDIASELPEQYKLEMIWISTVNQDGKISSVKWSLDYPCIVNEKWETSANVDLSNIVSINTYTANEAVKRYGSRAQNGVIAITTQ